MCKILIFGGTTEGRLLAEFCDRERLPVFVSVTSDYGKELLKKSSFLNIHSAAMDEAEMIAFIRRHQIKLVVDATHPYAEEATVNIKNACDHTKIEYLRCERALGTGHQENVIGVSCADQALHILEEQPGNVLLTTGSKELPVFCQRAEMRSRIYARVLPSVEVLKTCIDLGLEKSHIIGMQGPFSEELNIALIHQVKARFLVTKQSGAVGGFEEKLEAAKHCGIPAIVIGHKEETTGLSVYECCQVIKQYCSADSGLHVTLAGIGPGHKSEMTGAVIELIKSSEVLFGAPRVLEAAEQILKETAGYDRDRGCELVPLYLPEDVARWIEERDVRSPDRALKRAAVLFSGDTGFYSGAKKMAALFSQKKISYFLEPGLSSLSLFASRLGIGWEDAKICSAHGRDFNLAKAFEGGEKKLFVLTGGENGAGKLCESLCEAGYGNIRVFIGENLSYPEERILSGTAGSMKKERFASLSMMMIERTKEEGEKE